MDSVYVAALQAFPPSGDLTDPKQFHKRVQLHVQRIEKIAKENEFVSNAERILKSLNPAEHSISYLAALTAALNAVPKNAHIPDELLEKVVRFLLQYDQRQIRYVGEVFSRLLNIVVAGEILPASIAVETLAHALLRLDPTGSILTSHHLALVQLAYEANQVEEALPVIDKAIISYPGMTGSLIDQSVPADMSLPPAEYITIQSGLTKKLTTRSVLLYDLLSALCFISIRSWSRAYDALERVLAYPSKDGGCSKMMVEAHNKWVLVGLLLEGTAPEVPNILSQAVQKTYSTLGKPYYAIARAFEEKTAHNLKREIEFQGEKFWTQDGNLSLIQEVISHYQRWQILGLRDIYSKVSLEEIRTSTQSGETAAPLETVDAVEALLSSMSAEGMLDGAVVKPTDGKPAYLAFNDQAERSEVAFGAELLATTQRIKNLKPVIKAANERLATNREYIKCLAKEQKREQDQAGKAHAQVVDQIEDEDLMTGVIAT